ncbi:MAG: tetratricopeptide repeat protein [Candidatus Eisenbacteria bacterium]|uniref:Tetratricopeptide repeat protein n=1 Tax=Eiseniibacteriota bacterium TaxID=2212470 RepID=A0A538TU73_UNCEI|nr:MAG: tetratricopeptide repeat protein [Candidatus Eisenbacteria bacterium]
MDKTTTDLIREREEAVSTARLAQDPERHLQSLEDLAEIFVRADSYLPALQNLEECIRSAERLGLDPSRIAALELKAAQVLIERGDAPGALKHLARARGRALTDTSPELLARLQLQSGRALIELSQYEEALGCCERAHAYFKDHNLMAPLAHAYNCFGRIHFRLGDLDKAKEFYEAALHLFRWDLNDEEGVIRAHNNLGVLYRHLSDWRQATWHLLRSMEISTRLGNFAFISVSCANIGIVHLKAGSWDEAAEHFDRALNSYVQIGRESGVARMRIGLATIATFRHDFATAEAHLTAASQITSRLGSSREQILCLFSRGELQFEMKRIDDALELYGEALEMARLIAPEGDMVHELQRRRAEAFAARGDLPLALKAADDALARALRLKDQLEEGATRRVLALIHTLEGKLTYANEQARDSMRILESIHERFELARAYLEQARRMPANGEPERAREAQNLAFKAMYLFEQLGMEDSMRTCEVALRDLNAPSWITAPRGQRTTTASSSQSQDIARAHGVISQNPRTLELVRKASELVTTPARVLIQGETGTGKNLFAYMFRSFEVERGRPFVEVNCTSLPGDLVESELFGYVRGAFTGAAVTKRGIFEEADGGTIFLNEIGELSERTQVKLLQVLDDGTYRRLGEVRSRRLNVRIISATNKDLDAAVKAGWFRADLYYRLGQVLLALPPLRERREDIPLLIRNFLDELSAREGRQVVLAEDALEYWVSLPWMGNVRELKHKVESVFLCAARQELVDRATLIRLLYPGGTPAADAHPIRGLRGKVDLLKREEILAALSRNAGNRSRAALELGITRRHLIRLLKQIY